MENFCKISFSDRNDSRRKRSRRKSPVTETAKTETAISNRSDQNGHIESVRPKRPDRKILFRDDLFIGLNNIKAGCCIGEVLFNHLIFPNDICEICPSVRGLQSIQNLCQAYAELEGIILNCSKTVCMTFEAKHSKSSHPVTETG